MMNISPPRLAAGLLLMIWYVLPVQGQLWWEQVALPRQDAWADERPLPLSYQALQFDMAQFATKLSAAPLRFSEQEGLLLAFPVMGLDTVWFRFFQDQVMHPSLAATFPEIKTWYGVESGPSGRRIRLGVGPGGLHAMIISPTEETIFMDAWDRFSSDGPVVVYTKSAYTTPEKGALHCELAHAQPESDPMEEEASSRASGPSLLIYRLALACTGEYAQFHGGTKSLVLAAMVKTITRVNGIYERDFGARMELIPNNDLLIFLDPLTDPYDNGSISTMLGQNQQTIDAVIGFENYDVGHVFGTQGGGRATLSSLCKATKARGATGLSNPFGDPFDVDYVSHEFGHQFGCNHTFNNSCDGNRFGPAAMEPGSGSTIMAYAGVCAPNVKGLSDDYFHAFNLMEARNYIVNGFGNTCPQQFFTGNEEPWVDAGPNRHIPHSTPFELTAQAFDPDGDIMTFTWEQYDNDIAPMPPEGTNAGGPLFRSFPPDTSQTRVFPNMAAIRLGQIPTWEVLPEVGRIMRFRVTARDNHPDHGRWKQDQVQLTVAGSSGPFRVLAPNTSLVWYVGDTVTVEWDVALSDQAPVLCSHVDISLSIDGGRTYPILLAGKVPNTGSTAMVVPFVLSPNARVKIKAVDNVFFDISDVDFRIEEPPLPAFIASGLKDSLSYCQGQDTLLFEVVLTPLSGFDGLIATALQGVAFGATDLPLELYLQAEDTLRFRVWDLQASGPGPHVMELRLLHTALERVLTYNLYPSFSLDHQVVPVFPPDNGEALAREITLVWETVAGAAGYTIELSERAAFLPSQTQVLASADTSITVTLPASTTWFWRVRAHNLCGLNPPMSTLAFRTLLLDCEDLAWPGTPQQTEGGNTYNLPLDVSQQGVVEELSVRVDMTYGDLSKLVLRLMHPSGIGRNLLFRACPEASDVHATFSDEGQDFACTKAVPAVQGILKPQTGPLSNFVGLATGGIWNLRIVDESEELMGMLNEAVLTLCQVLPTPPQPQLTRLDTLILPYCGEGPLTRNELDLVDTLGGDLFLTLRQAPEEGTLFLDGLPVVAGDTIPVHALDAATLLYWHQGGGKLSDRFRLDVFNQATDGWLGGLWVPVVLYTDLQGEVLMEEAIRCHGDSTGRLAIHISGAKPPLDYRRLPEGDWQSDSVFPDLPAGTYTFEVRDSNGFMYQTPLFELVQPPILDLTYTLSGAQLLLLGSGGTPPYHYRVGQDSNTTGVFTLPVSGIYPVELVDTAGCRLEQEIEVTLLEVAVQFTEPACHGEATGSIEIIATGGQAPLSYRLDEGAWQPTPYFDQLSAGSYVPGVQDASQVEYLLDEVILGQPDLLSLQGAQSADSTVTLVASGGTPPWTYRIQGGGSWQLQPVFEGLSAGTYTFYVADMAGCTDSVEILILASSITYGPSMEAAVRLFPNPASGQVDVVLTGWASRQWQWTLVDLLGRPALSGEVEAPGWRIALHTLPAGIYYLHVRSEYAQRIVPLRIE
jgi:subtilisin-like proprotein convertase family protein